MAVYTMRLSRGLSSVEGKSNGKPVTQVLELRPGDHSDEYKTKKEMKKLFYWRTLDLTEQQAEDINMAIKSPHVDPVTFLTIYRRKTVELDCFSAQDKVDFAVRGPVNSKKGGTIQNSNFIISDV